MSEWTQKEFDGLTTALTGAHVVRRRAERIGWLVGALLHHSVFLIVTLGVVFGAIAAGYLPKDPSALPTLSVAETIMTVAVVGGIYETLDLLMRRHDGRIGRWLFRNRLQRKYRLVADAIVMGGTTLWQIAPTIRELHTDAYDAAAQELARHPLGPQLPMP
ncbi:hypothetical protein HY632_01885 [Candidatus Uhrbacteria bacterium]|nr:hypothetical protein [Candidatus Uhrbacteria bacterium]